jgi:hypothetical protein
MKTIARPIGRFFKNGFKSTGISVEEKIYYYDGKPQVGYIVYQNSIIFWLPTKDRIVICNDIDQLKEINIRCNLGLKI